MADRDHLNDGGPSRREFLRAASWSALGAGALLLGGPEAAAWAQAQQPQGQGQGQGRGQGQRRGPYAPFRVGLQSYSLRAFNLDEALAMTQKFRLRNWESFQAHIPQTDSPEKIQAVLDKLTAARVRLASWGVQAFDGDEAKSRKIFEFAKAIKVGTITADPAPDSFAVLDKLVDEYKINIAIHNHGPGARYSTIASVADAIKGHNERIGACVDTGHYLRSGVDPVEAVKAFGKRVYSVHLKDVKNKTEFTEVGQGDLRVADLFKELKALNYRGIVALEYEEHEKDPAPYIEKCLTATREAIAKANA